MEFALLGEVEAQLAGEQVDLGHARQRCVLAVLLVEANRVVHVDQLVERIWAGDQPQRARNSLYSYLSRLRSCLEAADGTTITRRSGGYLLTVDPALVDLHRFRNLISQAHAAEDDESALRMFDEAITLWRGEPFAQLDTPWFNTMREVLERERRAAEADRTDVALRCGQHAAILPDLLRRIQEQSLDERLTGQVMLALYRAGRQAEAIDYYQRLRRELAEVTGVDPGPELQETYLRILDADPAVAAPPATSVTGPVQHPIPRQLPPPPPLFSGREPELAELTIALNADSTDNDAVMITAIAGPGGIGKTWLALRWAYDNIDRFPDGQLYVNLRGFDPSAEPMPLLAALRGFLDALGVAPDSIPVGVDAQTGLYRSLMSNRRILVVLDNAYDTAQVVPLLPNSATCTVLVTSRRRLGGLVAAHGAHALALEVLDDEAARRLLLRRLGSRRADDENGSLTALLQRCGGLPLALSIVAARAATHPDLPLKAFAEELSEHATRLDALSIGELGADLRAVFAASLRALTPEAANTFGLLGLVPGPDIGLLAAASLLGEPPTRTRVVLRELHEAHLIHQHAPDRYRMHDLVRLYATERVDQDQSPETCQAARHRILDHYLLTAHVATTLIEPSRNPITLSPAVPGVATTPLTDEKQASSWFNTERQGLVGLVDWAANNGFDTHSWQLAWALESFLDDSGHWHDWTATQETALRSAYRLGARPWQAQSHRSLGLAHTQLGKLDSAHDHHQKALQLYGELGDLVSQGHTHRALGWVCDQQDRWREAIRHNELALELYRQAGHQAGQAMALNNAGWLLAQLGDHKAAISYCEQAVTINQEIGDQNAEAGAWDSLGYVHHQLGAHQDAIHCYQQALLLVRRFHDRFNEADILAHLGDSYLAIGEVDAARHSLRQARNILHEIGHPALKEVDIKLRSLDQRAEAGAG
ncbi:AfsR/SARP family transcriptional regulator [Micromonospora sp. NPDC003197]